MLVRNRTLHSLVPGRRIDLGQELGLAGQAADPVRAVGPGAGRDEGFGHRDDAGEVSSDKVLFGPGEALATPDPGAMEREHDRRRPGPSGLPAAGPGC